MALAILTSVFNCVKNSLRHRHYETFKENLGDLPLYTVELAFDDYPFVLLPNDNLLQLRSSVWMWQRDRIVNKLLEIVPKKYDNIALIDADILFHDPNWPKDTEGMLRECLVGQLFAECHHSKADLPPDKGISNRDQGIIHTGYAWAARRSFLDEFGLYDKSPVGGNDVLMTCAYCGWYKHPYFRHLPPSFMERFSVWGNQVFKATKGDVGYVNSSITHLWHGSKQKRDYIGRLDLIKDFDPDKDLKIGENGCYEWASDKPEMHMGVEQYMKGRMDG